MGFNGLTNAVGCGGGLVEQYIPPPTHTTTQQYTYNHYI